jgi:hypothetical protein
MLTTNRHPDLQRIKKFILKFNALAIIIAVGKKKARQNIRQAFSFNL